MTSRREFLKRLIAVPVAAVVAPVLGEFVSARGVVATPRLNLDELNAITLKHFIPTIRDDFFRNDPLLAYFQAKGLEGRTARASNIQFPIHITDGPSALDWINPDGSRESYVRTASTGPWEQRE